MIILTGCALACAPRALPTRPLRPAQRAQCELPPHHAWETTPVHPFQERLALGALGAAVRLGAPQMEGPQLAGELGSSSSVV